MTAGSDKPNPARRSFLRIVWSFLGLAVLAEIVWVVISFFRPVPEKNSRDSYGDLVKAGSVDAYTPGSVSAFVVGRFYLVTLEDGGFLAVSSQCTHLGCALPWDGEKHLFICPCHASVFDIRGDVIGSPAPRALDLFPVTIVNREIMVDTGSRIRRNRFSKGQPVYPDSIRQEDGRRS